MSSFSPAHRRRGRGVSSYVSDHDDDEDVTSTTPHAELVFGAPVPIEPGLVGASREYGHSSTTLSGAFGRTFWTL